MDCIFCKIIAGEIPSKKLYEDDAVVAIEDINPQAPFHALIMPKEHIVSAADITPENSGIAAHIFEVAAMIAKERGLDGGFRIVTNSGADGCQSVPHMHFHLLGGTKLTEKMC